MPEHEWKQGDAVWYRYTEAAAWLAGEIVGFCDRRFCRADDGHAIIRRPSSRQLTHPEVFYIWVGNLRPRDPAKNGADRPAAHGRLHTGGSRGILYFTEVRGGVETPHKRQTDEGHTTQAQGWRSDALQQRVRCPQW